MTTTLDDFKHFVTHMQSAAYYSKWASQNPKELTRWAAFRDAIVSGGAPSVIPTMTTSFGAALVDAGMEYLDNNTPVPVPTPTPAPVPVGATCAFGAYVEGKQTYNHYYPGERAWDNPPWDLDTLNRFQQNANKKISMLMTGPGYVWQNSYGDLDFILSKNAELGTIPVIDLQTDGMGTLADFAAGKFDAQIDTLASHFKTFGKEAILRIDAEMNGGWYKFGAEIRASSTGPASFTAAWRRIVERFRAAGATNVKYHWCPNVDPENIQTPFEELYPGDDYVDWSGMTGYNHGNEAFDWVFKSTYDRLVKLTNKPIMIGEIGSADVSVPSTNPTKVQWINDMFAKLPTEYPQVKAFCWFNWYILENGKYWDWPIESSADALAAFKKGIASPYYV